MNKIIFHLHQFLLSVFFLLVFFIGCDRIHDPLNNMESQSNNRSDEGLCFYPTEIEKTSDLTYQFIDVGKAMITGEPIIVYDDIVYYDTTEHIVTLSYSLDSLKSRIGTVGVYGKPFLVTLDSIKIYGGWFWTPISSIACQWVMIEPDCLFDSLGINEIRINLGYSNENQFEGEDPRNNQEIFNRLIKDDKAR